MTAVDIGVRYSRPGNTDCRSTPSCPKGVTRASPSDAQGGALFPEIQTNTGKDFEATSESEEAHGLYQVRAGRVFSHEDHTFVIVRNGNEYSRDKYDVIDLWAILSAGDRHFFPRVSVPCVPHSVRARAENSVCNAFLILRYLRYEQQRNGHELAFASSRGHDS